MKKKESGDFRKELDEAERFGLPAVRAAMEKLLNESGGDAETLAALARFCLRRTAECGEEYDLTGTWLFLYDQIWRQARNCLDRESYHSFCEAVEDRYGKDSQCPGPFRGRRFLR